MKKIVLLISFALLVQLAQAQQDVQFTQYMFNLQSVNPAYAGSKTDLTFLFLSRNQWVGLEGSPKTQCAAIQMPVKKLNLGLGISYIRDKIGPLTTDKIDVDVAYRFKISSKGNLSLGVKAGVDQKNVNLLGLSPVEKNDPMYVNDLYTKLSPTFGAGVFYNTDHFYLGFSTPKLNESDLSTDGSAVMKGNDKQLRHYYLISGYVMDINNHLKFKPTIHAKYVRNAPMSFDLSTSLMFNDRFVAGVSYRVGDSFGAMFQANLFRNVWVGYAYDYTTTRLQKYNYGSHEIMLVFDVYKRAKDIIKSPRFF
jgi:type IX secretion system PorP/SprF family membrane protein